MNKNDIKLIIILIGIMVIIFIVIRFSSKKGNVAEVFYEDEVILKIDLSKDGEYTVNGLLGDVVLEVKDNKIRVKSENSDKHICSKEGYIGDSGKSLICLPNKIIVKIISDNEIDGVVY